MSYQISGLTARGFFRLTGTAQTAAAPNTTDSDGDGLLDIDDAVPGDRLIDWKKAPESSYILIDVDVPDEGGSAQDLNDKGEILFEHGIWSGGDWIPRQAQDGSGTVPITDGAEYDIHYGPNWFFNDSRHLLGVAGITFTTTEAAGGSGIAYPTFWPTVQSSPSLIYDTADMWDNCAWSFWPVGVSKNGDMAIRITLMRGPNPGTAPTQTIDRFDSSGARTGSMNSTGGYHPSGAWQHGDTTSSGWLASNLARESTEAQPAAAYKVGLWNDSNTLQTLPAEAEGWGYPIRVSDVPNSKIALVAGQWSGSVHKGRVFLSDANGDMKYSSSLSDQKL